MEDNKKQEVEEKSIFPEATVGGTTVKPWKFGVLFEISHLIEDILNKMEIKGVSIYAGVDGFLPYTTIARIFTIASGSVLKIISITLKLPEEEVIEFDMDKGMEIASIIYKQNSEQIKNSINKIFIE